jgi:hypothetical protein
MNGFEAYETYLAVKAHFTRKTYDFHRFNGKVNTSVSAFEARSDKAFFFRICKKYPNQKLIDLYVANFIDNPSIWIGDLLDEQAEEVYTEWQRRVEGMSYHFQEECVGLLGWAEKNRYKFNQLFQVHGNDHPVIVKMALQKVVSIETFIVLNQLLSFGPKIDKKLDDIIWRDLWFKVGKYRPFLNIETERCKNILRTKIETEYKTVI